MDILQSICNAHNLVLIEDNAHGLYGRYRGRMLGSFGSMATQSFHETKNFTCGEGGALVVNDPAFVERAEIIREKGTDRSKFFRGQVDKYSWIDKGSSYVLSDILAAMLLAQLLASDIVQAKRKALWLRYQQELQSWAQHARVALPFVPDHCEHSYHMFYLLMPDVNCRDDFIRYLANKKISAVFHYLPLNLSKMGRSLGGENQPCPVSVETSEKLVRLPFYTNMSAKDQTRVIETITAFKPAVRIRAE